MVIAKSRLLALALLIALTGCSGMDETKLGLTRDGLFKNCPSSPNCVSSDATDEKHRIEPFKLKVDATRAWEALASHIESQSLLTIVSREPDYLHVEARTRLLRFTDDVEFHLRESSNEVAVRSASRVGYSDLGANRKRLEGIRDALSEGGIVEP